MLLELHWESPYLQALFALVALYRKNLIIPIFCLLRTIINCFNEEWAWGLGKLLIFGPKQNHSLTFSSDSHHALAHLIWEKKKISLPQTSSHFPIYCSLSLVTDSTTSTMYSHFTCYLQNSATFQACMCPTIISRSVDLRRAEGPFTKIPEGPGLSPPMVCNWRNPPASRISSVMDRFLDRRIVGFNPGPKAIWWCIAGVGSRSLRLLGSDWRESS